MKYIDADRLRAEIERRTKELDEQIVDIYDSKAILRKDELQKLLSFIDYLQQEQPEVDLEKEIHMYFNPHGMELQFDRSKGNTILKPEQLIDFARHFYSLGLNARKV